MGVRWLGLFVLTVLLLGNPVSGQEDAPALDLTFTFQTTPEVSIKLKAPNLGRPVRGKLLTLTDGEVIVDTGVLSRRDRERGERGQRVPFSRMESLRTTDGRFEFSPEEGFKVFAQRAVDTYPSIRVDGNISQLELDRPPRARSKNKGDDDDEDPVRPALPGATDPEMDDEKTSKGSMAGKSPPQKAPGIGSRGIGGLKNLPKVNKTKQGQSDESESDDPSEDPSSSNNDAEVAESNEELICSNCQKVLPRSAVKKGECPHCHATFISPPQSSPGSSGQGAFAASGHPPGSAAGAFAPVGHAPAEQVAPVAGQPASNTVVVQGGNGFSFDQVPNWAKGGIFILVLLVGYHVLFNR